MWMHFCRGRTFSGGPQAAEPSRRISCLNYQQSEGSKEHRLCFCNVHRQSQSHLHPNLWTEMYIADTDRYNHHSSEKRPVNSPDPKVMPRRALFLCLRANMSCNCHRDQVSLIYVSTSSKKISCVSEHHALFTQCRAQNKSINSSSYFSIFPSKITPKTNF